MIAKNRGLLNWSMVLPELLNPGWIEVFDLFEPVTDKPGKKETTNIEQNK
jgi:hypothetical protein